MIEIILQNESTLGSYQKVDVTIFTIGVGDNSYSCQHYQTWVHSLSSSVATGQESLCDPLKFG